MKKLLLTLSVVAGLTMAVSVSAEDKAEEKKIKGVGMCAKCELKQASKCQNAIKVKEGDKEVVYLLEANDVSKQFHKNVCSETKKVVAVGTVKEVDGKKVLVAKSIKIDPEAK